MILETGTYIEKKKLRFKPSLSVLSISRQRRLFTPSAFFKYYNRMLLELFLLDL